MSDLAKVRFLVSEISRRGGKASAIKMHPDTWAHLAKDADFDGGAIFGVKVLVDDRLDFGQVYVVGDAPKAETSE